LAEGRAVLSFSRISRMLLLRNSSEDSSEIELCPNFAPHEIENVDASLQFGLFEIPNVGVNNAQRCSIYRGSLFLAMFTRKS